jgi:hypothetical protein
MFSSVSVSVVLIISLVSLPDEATRAGDPMVTCKILYRRADGAVRGDTEFTPVMRYYHSRMRNVKPKEKAAPRFP